MINKSLVTVIAVLIVVAAIVIAIGKIGKKATIPSYTTQTQQTPKSAPPQTSTTSASKENMITVTVTNSGFSPQTVTVKTGARVVWLNKSGGAVTVNSDVHPTHLVYPPLNLGGFPDGTSVQLVFDKPGTYKYHNHLNPSQTGTVVVQ